MSTGQTWSGAAVLLLAHSVGCANGDPVDQRVPSSESSWVSVSAHPCAQHRDGRVRCWNRAAWSESERVEDSPWPVDNWTTWSLLAWGRRTESGVAEAWNGLGPSNDPATSPVPAADLVGGTSDCGIHAEGTVGCWGHTGEWSQEGVLTDDSGIRLFDDSGGYPLVLHRSGWLAAGEEWNPMVDVWPEDPESIVGMAYNVEYGCWLRDSGVVECTPSERAWAVPPPPPIAFPNPPYVAIGGSNHHICAQQESGVLDCSHGETYDFGPIRDFDLRSEIRSDVAGVYESNTVPLNVCVLTADDRIECEGPRYTPRLMEKVWADAG